MSRFLWQKIPAQAGSHFDTSNWEQALRRQWFSSDELKDRDHIASWALTTDSVEKARAVESAIDHVLEIKKADAE
jgi:hypothetical protein